MTHAAGSLAVPVPPAMGVERATTQTSPLGASVLEAISETYRGHSAPLDHRVGLLEGVRPGPPQKLPAEGDARTGTLGGVFETMIAGLRDLHYGVTRVALLSKGVSGITSSVNKLLKEG
ncbi:nodulation protein NolB [Sinorhizobium meliloti]|nr:nodulation protein NolB [Sinorhizobium meliloti]